ncbi:uncharacterized protein EV420DRAFT_1486833 [Desarmillaria tabescens]|uniref:Uncharacterized protein n=1 Tax=Armillaria tabescens TaxID=1929756 RepID=A0AA39MLL7_ARMTA|nr:uncharacterized protein EV420DRAFT_1486833 [Desarmillaria tabescens]KAK0437960.1 hypothetical protein EV420DRAFT_1486833 [Desarmillaria tabescens]
MHEAVVNLEIISVLHRYIPEYRVETYIICARSTTAELTASPRHHMETHDLRQYAYADTLTSYATPDLSHIFPESLQPDNTFNNMAVNFSVTLNARNLHTGWNIRDKEDMMVLRHVSTSLMLDQLPPEIIHTIISEFWYSEHSSGDRIIFMKTCPLINSLWMDVFAHIASRDIFVLTNEYLFYLSSIIRNNNSLIYRHYLPHFTRTITCRVDLIYATEDVDQEPYTTLSNLPNFIGFRKCFPNITHIFLEIGYCVRRGFFYLIMSQDQIVRTRISIALDQATTQLSALPVDWEIVVYDLAPYFISDEYADPDWIVFLRDATCAMAPAALSKCVKEIPLEDMLSHSTYLNCVRRFSGHGVHTETEGDARGINRCFAKAIRRPFSESNSFFH